jgi:acetolactate synthase-1/2/3 large subunit
MTFSLSRRDLLKTAAAGAAVTLAAGAVPRADAGSQRAPAGWVSGRMTGAEAVVETLLQEGVGCVFGIPGAQENELWDAMKSRHLGYLLVTHEFSAAAMADGYARSTGRPGVLCVVPGPGVTNALSAVGEALLDSVPLVCIVGDVARGDKYRAFQVHELPQAGLLQQVTKGLFEVKHQAEIPAAIRQAFHLAQAGEPGPAAVTIPYNLLIETCHYQVPPLEPPAVPFDDQAFAQALGLLSQGRPRVGIYAGLGCMNYSPSLVRLAEVLQAPVATSISGKGAFPENHPLSVGWGYGPQGTIVAEDVFRHLQVILAIGVRYSEVSTAFYSIPPIGKLIHVDINANNLGRNMKTDVCVHADAGIFMDRLLERTDVLQRPCASKLLAGIQAAKKEEYAHHSIVYARCGVDPMLFIRALRRCTSEDCLLFCDVTASEYWVAETFTTFRPRTFFNPTNNQSMGWSIPAALGAQRVHPGRQTVTITGDGCFLMSAMEISTAARECLPVKFFVLDDQSYHYMQALQRPAYLRTTATILARLNYAALAQGLGVAYQEIGSTSDLEACIAGTLAHNGPVLTRVVTDYRKRPIRWINAAKDRYLTELTTEQKLRFMARVGSRAMDMRPEND